MRTRSRPPPIRCESSTKTATANSRPMSFGPPGRPAQGLRADRARAASADEAPEEVLKNRRELECGTEFQSVIPRRDDFAQYERLRRRIENPCLPATGMSPLLVRRR